MNPFAKLKRLSLMPCPLCGMHLGIGFTAVKHMLLWHPDIAEKGKAHWLPLVTEARRQWLGEFRPTIRDKAHGLLLCSWLGHIDAHRINDPQDTTRCCKCFSLLEKRK